MNVSVFPLILTESFTLAGVVFGRITPVSERVYRGSRLVQT